MSTYDSEALDMSDSRKITQTDVSATTPRWMHIKKVAWKDWVYFLIYMIVCMTVTLILLV